MIKNSDELQLALKAAQSACLEELNERVHTSSGTLFHYTDLSGCLSILRDGKIRLTDARYCNDPEEISGGLAILNKVHNEVISQYRSSNIDFCTIMTFLFHLLNVATTFKESERTLLASANSELNELGVNPNSISNARSSIFVACFSEKGNDLRQWMPYADDGMGAALGFKGFDGYHHFNDGGDHTYLVKVSYATVEKKENYVRNFYESAFHIFNELEKSLVPTFVGALYQEMFTDIIACKSSDYVDEAEWRLFLIEDAKSASQEFRVSKNVIKPYIELPLRKTSLLQIVLGPKSVDLNKNSIAAMIDQFGYENAHISKSAIAYR